MSAPTTEPQVTQERDIIEPGNGHMTGRTLGPRRDDRLTGRHSIHTHIEETSHHQTNRKDPQIEPPGIYHIRIL